MGDAANTLMDEVHRIEKDMVRWILKRLDKMDPEEKREILTGLYYKGYKIKPYVQELFTKEPDSFDHAPSVNMVYYRLTDNRTQFMFKKSDNKTIKPHCYLEDN